VSSTADLGSYDATTGLWTVGNMPPNVSVSLRIVVTMTGSAGVINTAEVYAVAEADPDSTPNNNALGEDDQKSVTIGTIVASNAAPELAAIANRTVNEGTKISFVAQATDPDMPAQILTYSLAPGAPAGATINPQTGAFSWTPGAPGVYKVTVLVTDSGTPALQASRTVTFTVKGVTPAVGIGSDLSVRPYETFVRTGSFQDPGTGPYTAIVDYGDGSGTHPLTLNPDHTFRLSHYYSKSGRYVVRVNVTDQTRLVGRDTMLVNVLTPAPSGFGAGRDGFVTTLYLENLNRDPEPSGLRFWSRALAAGAAPVAVAHLFYTRPQHWALVSQGVLPAISFHRSYATALRAGQLAAATRLAPPAGPLSLAAIRRASALSPKH
jgi:hypothetical protein